MEFKNPSNIISYVRATLLTLFLLIGVLINVISFAGWFFYTKIVIMYIRLFRLDFGNVLSGKSEMFYDDYSKISSNFATASLLKLGGSSLNLQRLKQIFMDNVLEAKLASGDMRYPELRQYQCNFMGHIFWRNDPNFLLENHISEQIFTEEIPSNSDILEEMVNRTFPAKRSPWQVILIKGLGDEGCCWLVIRMHHSMADGKSALKLIVECLGKKEMKTATSSERERTFFDNFWNNVCFPANFLRFVKIVFEATEETIRHPWRVKAVKGGGNQRMHISLSPSISLRILKDYAKRNGNLQLSAVILGVLTGALRKFWIEERYSTADKFMFSLCSLPKPHHPETLANHMHCGILKLPLEMTSIRERVQFCNQSYRELKLSEVPRVGELISDLASPIVIPVKSKGRAFPLAAFRLSNIAGELEGFTLGGCEVVEYEFVSAIPKSSMGAGFIIFSYKDSLQIGAVAKSCILNKQKCQRLAELVGEEAKDVLISNFVDV